MARCFDRFDSSRYEPLPFGPIATGQYWNGPAYQLEYWYRGRLVGWISGIALYASYVPNVVISEFERRLTSRVL